MANDFRTKPSEQFDKIIKTARYCSSLVGADVFDKNFHYNWITAVLFACFTAYFICTFQTIYLIADWKYTLEGLSMIGSVFQGAAKLATGFICRKKLIYTQDELINIYMEYETKGEEYYDVLVKSCVRCQRVIKIIALLYIISVLGTILLPICSAVTTGERPLIMNFMLPGVDIKHLLGYIATLTVHIIIMFAGGFGLFAGDLFVVIFFMQSEVLVDLLRLKGQALQQCVGQVNLEQHILKDIFKWHQLYTE